MGNGLGFCEPFGSAGGESSAVGAGVREELAVGWELVLSEVHMGGDDMMLTGTSADGCEIGDAVGSTFVSFLGYEHTALGLPFCTPTHVISQ